MFSQRPHFFVAEIYIIAEIGRRYLLPIHIFPQESFETKFLVVPLSRMLPAPLHPSRLRPAPAPTGRRECARAWEDGGICARARAASETTRSRSPVFRFSVLLNVQSCCERGRLRMSSRRRWWMCLKFLRSAALCLLLCSTSANGLNGFFSSLFSDDEETGVFEDHIISKYPT